MTKPSKKQKTRQSKPVTKEDIRRYHARKDREWEIELAADGARSGSWLGGHIQRAKEEKAAQEADLKRRKPFIISFLILALFFSFLLFTWGAYALIWETLAVLFAGAFISLVFPDKWNLVFVLSLVAVLIAIILDPLLHSTLDLFLISGNTVSTYSDSIRINLARFFIFVGAYLFTGNVMLHMEREGED